MQKVTFDNGATVHEIPDEVHKYLQGYSDKCDLLQAKLNVITDAVKEYAVKRETARAHPTKDTKIAKWAARGTLFGLVRKVEQSDLFKQSQ